MYSKFIINPSNAFWLIAFTPVILNTIQTHTHKTLLKSQIPNMELMLNNQLRSISIPNFIDLILQMTNWKNNQTHHFFYIVSLTFDPWTWKVIQLRMLAQATCVPNLRIICSVPFDLLCSHHSYVGRQAVLQWNHYIPWSFRYEWYYYQLQKLWEMLCLTLSSVLCLLVAWAQIKNKDVVLPV